MTRRRKAPRSDNVILIIDDNIEYLSSVRRLVERDGHEVMTASGAREGLELLKTRRVDLVLVDYFMPAMTGEDFVRELRTFDPLVQVVLQTGYASEQPPREMLRKLDIQGYHDKSEGPDKLGLWIDVGLKAAYSTQLLEKSRLGLKYILQATPELHRLQPLDDLLQGILLQTAGLLGAVDSFLAVNAPNAPPPLEKDGFVAIVQDEGEMRIRAATGRFRLDDSVERSLGPRELETLKQAIAEPNGGATASGTVASLRVGQETLGFVYLDRTNVSTADLELLDVFANQAAVAIQNARLYEMAALDPLTGTLARRFFEQALQREIRNAHRSGARIGLLMVDLDDMKQINDSGGHLAGDQALALTGKLLRRATRATDFVGRYGGDEFAILLPGVDAVGAEIVAERIRSGFASSTVTSPNGKLAVRGSIGIAVMEIGADANRFPPREGFDAKARDLIQRADEALYDEKRRKRVKSVA